MALLFSLSGPRVPAPRTLVFGHAQPPSLDSKLPRAGARSVGFPAASPAVGSAPGSSGVRTHAYTCVLSK